jgi:hypothetical protein
VIIVADASPLVLLISIGHVDVLASVFHRIIIPPEVHAELTSGKRTERVVISLDPMRRFVAGESHGSQRSRSWDATTRDKTPADDPTGAFGSSAK